MMLKGHRDECNEHLCYCADPDDPDPMCDCGEPGWMCRCDELAEDDSDPEDDAWETT